MEKLFKMVESHYKLTSKYSSLIGAYNGVLSFLIDVDAIKEPALQIIKEKMIQLDEEFDQITKEFTNQSKNNNNESNS